MLTDSLAPPPGCIILLGTSPFLAPSPRPFLLGASFSALAYLELQVQLQLRSHLPAFFARMANGEELELQVQLQLQSCDTAGSELELQVQLQLQSQQHRPRGSLQLTGIWPKAKFWQRFGVRMTCSFSPLGTSSACGCCGEGRGGSGQRR